MSEHTFTLTIGDRVLVNHRDTDGSPTRTRGDYLGQQFVGVADAQWAAVELDNGQTGGGENGEYLVPPTDLEPLRLQVGQQVSVECPGGPFYTRIAQNLGLHSYRVEGRDGRVPREDISLASFIVGDEPVAPPMPPMDISVEDAAAERSGDLNDGARLPSSLPNDSDLRKQYPLASVLFGQFPAATVALAHHSWKGNNKHNPGQPLQDARNKSTDDAECIMRHQLEGDYEGVAWRAMRQLQKHLEAEGAPVAPLATFD